MPENKILDPFKPAQPRIPGVSATEDKFPENGQPEETDETPGFMGPQGSVPVDNSSAWKFLWMGLTLAGALTTAFLLFGLKQKFTSQKMVTAPESPKAA